MTLLILSSAGQLAPAEGLAMRAARPFLLAFNGIGRQMSNVFTTARDLASLRARTQQLQTQVDTLTIENQQLQELQNENARLRELLRFRQLNPTYDFKGGQVIARVLSPGPSNYLSTIAIDLGA